MANADNHKTVAAGYGNDQDIVRVTWDYDVDGGAAAALNLITASGDVLVKEFHAIVKTAVASSGSLTLIGGIAGGDTDAAFSSVPASTLALDYVIQQASTVPFLLSDGESVAQTIGTAPASAGKIEYVFSLMKP